MALKRIPEHLWHNWRWQYRHRVRTLAGLADFFSDHPKALEKLRAVSTQYPFSVTPYYLSLINPADDKDPLRLQAFPDPKEIEFTLGGREDPLEETGYMPVPGLIHRYPDRCLIIVTHACAVYCRHCNRKRLWRKKQPAPSPSYWKKMLDYIARTPGIREVILSGGDPLTLHDDVLEGLLRSIRAIPHVEILRIGSRMPVVLPMRITKEHCAMLRRYRPIWFNTQFNHPAEITPESAKACSLLLEGGIPVSNQSVLLRGVNDSYETMRDLLQGLQRIAVRPYYLFQCDPVAGTDHFRVDIWTGMEIMEKLWVNVSGLCLPRYVIDLPGRNRKIPLQPFSLLTCREPL